MTDEEEFSGCGYCGMKEEHSKDCVYYPEPMRTGHENQFLDLKPEVLPSLADLSPQQLDFAEFHKKFGDVIQGKVTEERRKLAEQRMMALGAKLAQENETFIGFLKAVGIPYEKMDDDKGRKAIFILLEDIAEYDMKRQGQ